MLSWRPVFILFAGSLTSSLAHATSAEITAEGREFFEAKIRPVLIAECYECHSGKDKKGGLLLDSRMALLEGGGNGASIIPGDPDNSVLIQTLRHEHADSDMHMPKNGAKLEDSIIADFVKWVQMGAPDPRDKAEAVTIGAGTWEQAFNLRKNWWSFQPLKVREPEEKGWMNPVDNFIQEKLDTAGLKPQSRADKRTLIRRLSYVLTGLPPKAEDIKQFLADESPDAWEKQVDRYLASPAFGETWARRWMDLMRYAETHGSEGDPVIPYAWRYRDHLIRSFNTDVPYDQMVQEHIAGDLLKQPRLNHDLEINESLLATASLRMAEHGFQPVDSLDEQVKTVDNQIEVLTKSFLGLTVSCARCHDHKFDAISQKDYFALYGILASTKPGQVMIDHPEKLRSHDGELARLKDQIRQQLADVWLLEIEQLEHALQGHDNHELIQAEQHLAALREQARGRVLAQRGVQQNGPAAKALAIWSFEGDSRDSVSGLDAELLGGATIKSGRLILDGVEAYARTEPLVDSLSEKTLEAWVALSNTDQRGGGVLTVEKKNGAIFDSIVFGEKAPREWINGSNNHRRTEATGGEWETVKPGELVHIVITYQKDNLVTIYRNGVRYGESYVSKDELSVFEANDSRVLLGRRHTGGGRAYLAGEVEEARLYAVALSAEEVAVSSKNGPLGVSDDELLVAMTEAQRTEAKTLQARITKLKKDAAANKRFIAWQDALSDARKDKRSPLYPLVSLQQKQGAAFSQAWQQMVAENQKELEQARQFNQEHFTSLWSAEKDGLAAWKGTAASGAKLSVTGDFFVEPEGGKLIDRILPAGLYSHSLSSKHGALLASPYFKMDTDSMSVRLTGGDGGGVRVMVDNYPLGNNGTYPEYKPKGEPMHWHRLDTTYRKGSQAYVEVATYDDLTRPQRPDNEKNKEAYTQSNGRSWFGISEVVLHKDGNEVPREIYQPAWWLLQGIEPTDQETLTQKVKTKLKEAVAAWKNHSLSTEQQVFLNFFVSKGLLSTELESLPDNLVSLAEEYRQIEADVPVPQRAPGPVEGDGMDVHLMVRGDHHQPGDLVSRGFLTAFGGTQLFDEGKQGSQRLQLSQAMTDGETNPLFARVMANRVWHWLFGRGLVATVDNFGRLGEKPTHPELLDWLAVRFSSEGYSVKSLIRLLLTTETWQRDHLVSDATAQKDAVNHLWSHMPVRRLEAEMIRDAMLQVSGMLNDDMYGAPVPDTSFRRSIYLPERRNSPHPFLEVYDRPKPATTRGQRDATNIPAQSLAMMNNQFVINLADRWAKRLLADTQTTDSIGGRLNMVYTEAFGRLPTDEEIKQAADYMGNDPGVPEWKDYLQAVFSLKEFIYLR